MSWMGIDDMTGIEAFVSLEELIAYGNNISTINLTNNINLQELNLSENFNLDSLYLDNPLLNEIDLDYCYNDLS